MSTFKRFPYWLTLPISIALLALLIYPLLHVLVLSVTQGSNNTFAFVWLGNFTEVLTSSVFLVSLKNTLVFTFSSTLFSFALGLSLALAMLNLSRAAGLFTTLLILPLAVMPVVSGLTWGMMLNPSLGVVNGLLDLLSISGPGWATSPNQALLTVMAIDVWQWTPFCFLILYSGLQTLPAEPFEAARLDGATYWQQLFQISLPMLFPIVLITLIFRFMEAFKTFDVIYAVTKGGPGRASETLIVTAFKRSFEFTDFHGAAVYGVVLLLITILLTRPAAYLLRQDA